MLTEIIKNSILQKNYIEPEDYISEEGLLICGRCNSKKQLIVDSPFEPEKKIKVYKMCTCRKAEQKLKEELRKKEAAFILENRLRREGLEDICYKNYTFENDDKRSPELSYICKKYADKFSEMSRNNIGLMFLGGAGTGKTFLASCIANALISRCISAYITSFPKIINTDIEKKKLYYSELVIIDDFGAQRTTSYGLEKVYYAIDTRLRSRKPLIITTNLTPSELKSPNNAEEERIYDRLFEMCIPLRLAGKSRRIEIKEKKKFLFNNIIEG